MARTPGQSSFIALLVSGFWTILALFIFIIGNLVWVFVGYGFFMNTDALAELEQFLPMLGQNYLYALAALALAADIWVIHSQRKEHKNKIKR